MKGILVGYTHVPVVLIAVCHSMWYKQTPFKMTNDLEYVKKEILLSFSVVTFDLQLIFEDSYGIVERSGFSLKTLWK